MADQFDINRRLATHDAQTKARLEGKMLGVSMRLRFGSTAELSKETQNAQRLAQWADQAQETYVDVFNTHWRAMSDPTLPEPGRLVKSARYARTKLDTMQRQYDEAMTTATATRDALADSLHAVLKPPSNPGEIAIDQEIRAVLRATPDVNDRMALAKKYPRAVVTAPVALSGVSEEGMNALVRDYWNQVAPVAMTEFQETSAAIAAAERAHKELTHGAREFIDFDRAALHEAHSFEAAA